MMILAVLHSLRYDFGSGARTRISRSRESRGSRAEIDFHREIGCQYRFVYAESVREVGNVLRREALVRPLPRYLPGRVSRIGNQGIEGKF